MYTLKELDEFTTDGDYFKFGELNTTYITETCDRKDFTGYIGMKVKNVPYPNNTYRISLTDPEFVSEQPVPLSKDNYDIFIKDLDNGLWDKIVETYEELCATSCFEDRFECPGYIARQEILKHMPDYKLLLHLE